MRAFEATDFTQMEPVSAKSPSRGDELDRLHDTFHAMARRILEQIQTLRHTDAGRRELVANVSHDLRTPLASLNGYLETLLLKEGQLSDEERRRYVDIAARHGRRLAVLVDELFELARLDSIETLLRCEPVALGELLNDVTQKFALTAQRKGITLECDGELDAPYVVADIALITRALENLLENALRHTPSGGRVRLELRRGSGHVAVVVSDTGCGIPAEELPKIFDRFYRLEKSRQSDADGFGLGLAIVQRIAELHGATLHAASVVNQGTTFRFELPVAS
jgi:signal transduction histidine kinase